MSPIASLLISFGILGTITFLYRFSFISNYGKRFAKKIPEDFLALLGPATFSAIIVNNILSHQSEPRELKQKTIVAVLALAVAYFTRNIIITLVFGLGLLYLLR